MLRRLVAPALGVALFSLAAVYFLDLSVRGFDPQAASVLGARAFGANAVVLAGWAAFWLLPVRRPVAALSLAGLTIVVLGVANARKIAELEEPLLVFDVFHLRNAPVLLGYASRRELAIVGAAGAAALLVFRRRGDRGQRRVPLHVPAACLLLAAVVAGGLASAGDSWAKRLFEVQDIYWDPLEKQRANGLVVASLLDLPHLSVRAPDRYENGQERELLEPFLSCDGGDEVGDRPHVVLALLESFWDPTGEGLAFDRDPLSFYRQLRERATVQHLVAPVFGGRTANSEFEVLTGLSTRFSPAGAIPYQQYLKRPLESVASVFRDHGYRTVAVHNFRRRFWNRDLVYPNLGFDEYVALEDLEDVPWVLGWPSDGALFERVERILSEAEQPTFVFAITVGTHGPYSGHGLVPTVLSLDSRPELAEPMSLYASKLELLDRHLERFVATLDGLEKPPVVVAFSDHLPTVASGALPAEPSDGPPRSRLVEALIWGAAHAAAAPGPRSLNCLGPEVLRLARIAPPPFFRFVESVCAELPVLTPHDAPSGDERILEKYRWLNYDRLFGAGYSDGLCRRT